MSERTSRLLLFMALFGVAAYFLWGRKSSRPEGEGSSIVVAPEENRAPEARFRVETPSAREGGAGLALELSSRSGGVRSLRLNGAQFRMPATNPGNRDDRRLDIATTEREELLPLRVDLRLARGGQSVAPAFLDFRGERVNDREARLTWTGEGVEVERTVRAVRPFTLDVVTVVRNTAEGDLTVDHRLPLYHYVTRDQESGGFMRQGWEIAEGLCGHGDDLYREARDELVGRNPQDALAGRARFLGLGNLYFLSAVVPVGADTRCRVFAEDRPNSEDAVGSVFGGSLSWPRATVHAGASQRFEALAYFGPKDRRFLSAAAPGGVLTDSINLGFFAMIARFLVRYLQFLFGLVHNWGLAIILLTITVRLGLYPLLAPQMKSMAAMQRLKPELDEINKRFADNPEAKGAATMDLYRRNNVNPLLGCLPLFAQLPVFWALYTTLQTSVEFFHAPFALWWQDLSAPDPYYVLPLLQGVTMFLQQKLMPPQGMDPVQAKMMMYFMPLFLTGISLFLPAGLALYMTVSAVLGILQQRVYMVQMQKLVAAGAGTGGGEAIVVKPLPSTSTSAARK
ncbi:MAG: membrane protein insertase YidC [Deltaproteobacteria bacterium]|nr:membrane protein insertase YidC [Deltaproteobacteria bacterium]